MRYVGLIGLMLLFCGGLDAAPYVPADDDVVVERLPEQIDPSLKEIKRFRAALARDPHNLDIAVAVAQRSIEAARATGDPRFLGQTQAALMPWWNADDPPSTALLLRATLKQSQHDFAGAIKDLDGLLAREPNNGQALITRATVLTVRGRYADAQADCRKLARLTSALVVASCTAAPASLSGNADDAYRTLMQALARGGDPPAIRAWALTLAAEIAARRGDGASADTHFQDAFKLDPRDAYLRAAYADFLLDNDRARDALPLLRDDTRNDSLLLRLALAERALPDMQAAFDAHRADLAARFDAARARGDTLHQREEARFELEIRGDAKKALALARDNWKVQREPADLRILGQAALAADDSAALQAFNSWIDDARLQDATLVAVRGAKR
jgi:Tfp pilus assembly protein PilF